MYIHMCCRHSLEPSCSLLLGSSCLWFTPVSECIILLVCSPTYQPYSHVCTSPFDSLSPSLHLVPPPPPPQSWRHISTLPGNGHWTYSTLIIHDNNHLICSMRLAFLNTQYPLIVMSLFYYTCIYLFSPSSFLYKKYMTETHQSQQTQRIICTCHDHTHTTSQNGHTIYTCI